MDPARINRIERELQQLRNGLAQRPHIVPAGGSVISNKILKIIDGQTVNPTLTYYGISKESSQLTTVPSAYDPNGVGSTPGLFTAITGIGRAYLIINGVLQANLVLVCHDTRTGSLVNNILVNGDYCQSWTTVTLLVGAGPTTVTAYIPQPL